MSNKITIPNDRKDFKRNDFYKQLEQRKEEHKFKWFQKYCELKYKLVVFACTYGIGIAILLWLLCSTPMFYNEEIKTAAALYLTTLITLYIGALLTKDFE